MISLPQCFADTPAGTASSVAAWQTLTANSCLALIDAADYHFAVTESDLIAPQVAAFIAAHNRESCLTIHRRHA